MYTNLALLYEGDIIKVQPRADGERNVIRYTCKVEMENGSQVILPNVQEMTPFGGISDYFRKRSRASTDDGNPFDVGFDQEKLDATIGERVYITFVGGNIMKPVIVGFSQHPNQTNEFEDENPSDLDPQLILQYLGIRIEADEKGQVRFIRKGAPQVKYEPQATGTSVPASTEPVKGGGNPAVVDADETEITLWEMLENGIFRIRDHEGQMIEIDRVKKRIYISNNDLKSVEDAAVGPASGGLQMAANATDAEYVLLDKDKELVLINAREIAQIYSFNRRKDVTEGLHRHKVGGNSVWIIGEDELVDVKGDRIHTVEGDDDLAVTGDRVLNTDGDEIRTVGGDCAEEIGGDWNVKCDGDINLEGSGGAVMKLGGGKVGIGGPAAELLALLEKTLIQLDGCLLQIQALTVPTLLGPSGPPLNAGNFAQLSAEVTKIKADLKQIKGGI
jgi:hypothetical protein